VIRDTHAMAAAIGDGSERVTIQSVRRREPLVDSAPTACGGRPCLDRG
jgi:hypothetical protein